MCQGDATSGESLEAVVQGRASRSAVGRLPAAQTRRGDPASCSSPPPSPSPRTRISCKTRARPRCWSAPPAGDSVKNSQDRSQLSNHSSLFHTASADRQRTGSAAPGRGDTHLRCWDPSSPRSARAPTGAGLRSEGAAITTRKPFTFPMRSSTSEQRKGRRSCRSRAAWLRGKGY